MELKKSDLLNNVWMKSCCVIFEWNLWNGKILREKRFDSFCLSAASILFPANTARGLARPFRPGGHAGPTFFAKTTLYSLRIIAQLNHLTVFSSSALMILSTQINVIPSENSFSLFYNKKYISNQNPEVEKTWNFHQIGTWCDVQSTNGHLFRYLPYYIIEKKSVQFQELFKVLINWAQNESPLFSLQIKLT